MRRIIPHALTGARFLCAVGLLTLLFGISFSPRTIQLLIIIGVLSDKLDGSLARWWHVESELGKKLESVVDPFFVFAAGAVLVSRTDFPTWAFWGGLVLALMGTVVRIVITWKNGKLFYEKSPITRFGVGFAYVLIVLYLFQIPFRELFLVPAGVYAIVMTFNYVRMMARYIRATSNLAEDAKPNGRQIQNPPRANTDSSDVQ